MRLGKFQSKWKHRTLLNARIYGEAGYPFPRDQNFCGEKHSRMSTATAGFAHTGIRTGIGRVLGFQWPPPPVPVQFNIQNRCSKQNSCLPPRLSTTLSAIDSSGVIACLRAQSGERAMEAARAALDGGISVLEITMTTPDVFEVIRGLAQQYPTSVLGVGTVLNTTDAKNAIKAGANFLMSPAMVKEILNDVQDTEVLYMPGVMTSTEVLTAYNAGAKVVKVYPVSLLGGVQYISALKRPFPHIPMVASQGITLDSIGPYIDQGASAVVLSDAIFEKEAMSGKNYDKIHQRACLAAVRSREVKRTKGCSFKK